MKKRGLNQLGWCILGYIDQQRKQRSIELHLLRKVEFVKRSEPNLTDQQTLQRKGAQEGRCSTRTSGREGGGGKRGRGGTESIWETQVIHNECTMDRLLLSLPTKGNSPPEKEIHVGSRRPRDYPTHLPKIERAPAIRSGGTLGLEW